jgi:hypothetical protein
MKWEPPPHTTFLDLPTHPALSATLCISHLSPCPALLPPTPTPRFLLDFLAERKSYSDLSSSIIDGRYTAQKWVMAGQDAARTCFYILEGNAADLNGFGQGVRGSVGAWVGGVWGAGARRKRAGTSREHEGRVGGCVGLWRGGGGVRG